ncbi:hypothetical protein LZ012_13785 [Dechloromonas sp. XY25]|uniref:Uncharacterized protein n=1 Tax=Dechloromonas hankyongensis TaxID=2908002 RepID=A0ABS9K4P7_9RHOO|nr:hypothetical protein [Dechloromonas hankyongensis]MCG2578060.1 hypothetical protein [Dechloromonas hankyongensis]
MQFMLFPHNQQIAFPTMATAADRIPSPLAGQLLMRIDVQIPPVPALFTGSSTMARPIE